MNEKYLDVDIKCCSVPSVLSFLPSLRIKNFLLEVHESLCHTYSYISWRAIGNWRQSMGIEHNLVDGFSPDQSFIKVLYVWCNRAQSIFYM